jgi:mxaJ protein
VVWGPLAGYFVRRDHLPVTIAAVWPVVDSSGVPFAYSMTMAVHKGDTALREKIDRAIVHLQPQINALLDRYNVPRLPGEKGAR